MEDDEELYQFWLELFNDALSAPHPSAVHFPVLVLEDTVSKRRLLPHYVTVNADEDAAGERSIKIWQVSNAEDGVEVLFKQVIYNCTNY